MRVGVIGIGNMGWPMAASLLRAGHEVRVHDSRPERASAFAREVGGSAASLDSLAGESEAIITILPTSAIVAEVMDRVLPALPPGTLLIEMTSGVPAITRDLAERAAQAGCALIDAPVSGGVARAETGQLAIMVGGADADVARATPLLEAMGSRLLRTGPIGSGQAMKALNNLVSAGGFLIGIEALLIGQKWGLDPAMMVEVLNVSSGMNNSTQRKFAQHVLSRRFASGFGLDLMAKDLGIALDIAHASATPAPFASLCRELWMAAAATLGGAQDHTAMAKFSERLAGTELRTAATEGEKA